MTAFEKIVKLTGEKELDAILITGRENERWALGCGPFEGVTFITRTGAGYLMTDGRYIEKARELVRGLELLTPDRSAGYAPHVSELAKKHGSKRIGFEDRVMSVAEFERYRAAMPDCEFVSVSADIAALRQIKTRKEIECITAAQRIAERALEDMLDIIKPGLTEAALRAELEYRMKKYGSEGEAFPTILVSGANTSLPHGKPTDKEVREGEFVTMDFGARVNGYCSDMTRTVAVGDITDEMRRVYDIVLRAQRAGIAALHEGAIPDEVDRAARSVIEDEGYGPAFLHGLGHSLGLNVHESPTTRGREPFPRGTVITMEPGIYLAGRFGVRIEDMIYLGENGAENLTLAPKHLVIL